MNTALFKSSCAGATVQGTSFSSTADQSRFLQLSVDRVQSCQSRLHDNSHQAKEACTVITCQLGFCNGYRSTKPGQSKQAQLMPLEVHGASLMILWDVECRA